MKVLFAALYGLVLCATTALADEVDFSAQLSYCASCHEAQGAGDAVGPPLAGQKIGYLRKQLFDFRSGVRNHAQMSPVAKSLSDAQIEALVTHYSSRPGSTPPAQRSLDPTVRPLVYCVRCHGPDGVSPNDLWPNLAGLDVDYMRRQIDAFANGARRDDMMQSWGGMIRGEEMDRILEYFSGVRQ